MPGTDDIVDMELERESMGTATQFEQATVEKQLISHKLYKVNLVELRGC
jgi:hypothetical protein